MRTERSQFSMPAEAVNAPQRRGSRFHVYGRNPIIQRKEQARKLSARKKYGEPPTTSKGPEGSNEEC